MKSSHEAASTECPASISDSVCPGGNTAHWAITETWEGAEPASGLGGGRRTWMQRENADSVKGRWRDRHVLEKKMKSREPDEQVFTVRSRRGAAQGGLTLPLPAGDTWGALRSCPAPAVLPVFLGSNRQSYEPTGTF